MDEAAAPDGGTKQISLRYPARCKQCGIDLAPGVRAVWDKSTHLVTCLACAPQLQAQVTRAHAETAHEAIESGTAGASAQREHDRRQAKDEQRLRDAWGPLGGIAVALSGERSSTKVWGGGAIGEAKVGARLDKLRSERIVVLHDRRVPRSRANIDHIVVTQCGVWVIDTKRYVDKRPSLRVEGGWIRPRTETLTVGGSSSNHLVDGVLKQVAAVQARVGDVAIEGVLCFVDGDWPLIGSDFTTQGVLVTWPRQLVSRIQHDTGRRIDVAGVASAIARMFPPA